MMPRHTEVLLLLILPLLLQLVKLMLEFVGTMLLISMHLCQLR